jgi:IMP dehydrogenase
MAGNVATKEGAHDLVTAGADSIKVGIGPGSICKTRIVTGAGIPQLTAIMDAKLGAGNVPIVADGGIRTSGDVTKALAAGASVVMVGSLFAGTDESPGKITMWNNRRSKFYRGMASLNAHIERKKWKKNDSNDEEFLDFVAEGADQTAVPYRGSVAEVLSQLTGGLRSGMSYCGTATIKELWKKAEFVKITNAGKNESGIHSVDY